VKTRQIVVTVLILAAVITGLIYLANKQDREVNAELAILQASRSSLLADFNGTDTARRIAALQYLRHDQSLWPELIRGLQENGNEKLAIAFVNIGEGHATLKHIDPIEFKDAGISWAESHGYKVMRYVRGLDQWIYLAPIDGE
jgi:hypothetical protein